MELAPRRGRPRELLLAWGAYWTTLAATKLGPGLAAISRVAGPGDAHGSVSLNAGDGVLRLLVSGPTATIWEGAVRLGVLALWIAGPPMLIWLAWLLLTRGRGASRPAVSTGSRGAIDELGAPGGMLPGAPVDRVVAMDRTHRPGPEPRDRVR